MDLYENIQVFIQDPIGSYRIMDAKHMGHTGFLARRVATAVEAQLTQRGLPSIGLL